MAEGIRDGAVNSVAGGDFRMGGKTGAGWKIVRAGTGPVEFADRRRLLLADGAGLRWVETRKPCLQDRNRPAAGAGPQVQTGCMAACV